MANYFRANIQAMSGYVPGEQPRDDGIIKLNTNENPYPPSPKVYAALRRAIDASLRLYPQPLSDALCAAAAAAYGVKPENIIAGNGSDELLSMLLRCFVGARRPGRLIQFRPIRSTIRWSRSRTGCRGACAFPGRFFRARRAGTPKRGADVSVQSQCAVRDAGVAGGDRKARRARLPAFSSSMRPTSILPPAKERRRFR